MRLGQKRRGGGWIDSQPDRGVFKSRSTGYKEGGQGRRGGLNEQDHDSYQSQFSITIIIISSCMGINMSSCSSVVRSGSGRKLILLSRPATKILQEGEKTKRKTVFYSFSLIKVKHPITKMVYSEGTRLRRLKSYESEHVKNLMWICNWLTNLRLLDLVALWSNILRLNSHISS